jgi:uncharacterized protein YjbI with pentapeptide repeats
LGFERFQLKLCLALQISSLPCHICILALHSKPEGLKPKGSETKGSKTREDCYMFTKRQNDLPQRYTSAIAQLSSDHIMTRLGGIYALERIANESEQYYLTVMEVLTAFVREYAPKEQKQIQDEPRAQVISVISIDRQTDRLTTEGEKRPKPSSDIQAALTAIGRRNRKHERGNRWFQEYQWINLRETNLAGADFGSYDWRGVRFDEANLQGANFSSAQLQEASLWRANLQGAELGGATLQGADILGANLQQASLFHTRLQTARLCEANLQGAMLMGANLQGAVLTKANLQGAMLSQANLQDALLTEANLQKASMKEANLKGADLSRANLDEASLFMAKLEGANLDGTCLQATNVQEADL